jgi:peptidyl-prolyl cis-trans isomerase D
MATLENIRKRGPLVAGFIGFALLMFIVSLSFDNGSKLFTGDPNNLAKVNGVKIGHQEYEQKVQETTNNIMRNNNLESLPEDQRQRIREAVWDNMVQMILLEGEYESIGMDVCPTELADLIKGTNVDQMVYNAPVFKNPETGVFDPARVVQVYNYMKEDKSGETKKYILDLERQVTENRKIRKYLSLIEKGLYYPKPLVETEFKNRNYLVDFDYVAKSYSEISDSAVTVDQSDLEKYYKEHRNDYEQETSRDVAYVAFDVIPSQKDSAYAQSWIKKTAEEFKTTENATQYINLNSDIPFEPNFFKKGQIEYALLDSFAFSADTGKIFGPYFEGGAFKVAKLLSFKNIPDSIEAKHILIAINGGSIPDMTKAKLVADSLKKVLNAGGDFAALAKEFSADKQSLEKGGDLGKVVYGQYVNQMPLQPFNELMDKKTNELVTVEKQYGIHLLMKTSAGEAVKKVQVGIIERKIVASTETFQKSYALASKFAGDNRNIKKFNEAITKFGYVRRVAPGLTENGTFIPGIESPRTLIKWAFNAKIGDVSEVFELGKRYVVGTLEDIKEKGIAPLKQVENIVRQEVIKEKKGDMLVAQYKKNLPSDIVGLAQKMKTDVREAKNISFSSIQIPAMGYEPYVIATAVTNEKGKISQPIKGNNGVYVLSVKIITAATDTKGLDLTIDKNKLSEDLRNRIYPNPNFGGTGQVLEALKKSADIEDHRIKFF